MSKTLKKTHTHTHATKHTDHIQNTTFSCLKSNQTLSGDSVTGLLDSSSPVILMNDDRMIGWTG